MSKWIVILLIGAIMAGFLLTPQTSPRARALQSTPIVVWTSWQDDNLELLLYIADTFMAANPQFQVDILAVPPGDYFPRLMAEIMAGEPPDLAFISYDQMRRLAASGLVMPLTTINQQTVNNRFTNNWSAWFYRPAGTQAELLGLPVVAYDSSVFAYSTDLFAEFGVQPPPNWGDMIALSEMFRDEGLTAVTIWSECELRNWLTNMAVRAGSEQDMVDLHNEFIDEGFINPDVFDNNIDNVQLPFEGEAGMTFINSWMDKYIAATFGLEPGIDYTFFTFPTINLNPNARVVDMMMLSRFSDKVAAEIFIDYMTVVPAVDLFIEHGFTLHNEYTNRQLYPDPNKEFIGDLLNQNNQILPLRCSALELQYDLFQDEEGRIDYFGAPGSYWWCVDRLLLSCAYPMTDCINGQASACQSAERCYTSVAQNGCVIW